MRKGMWRIPALIVLVSGWVLSIVYVWTVGIVVGSVTLLVWFLAEMLSWV